MENVNAMGVASWYQRPAKHFMFNGKHCIFIFVCHQNKTEHEMCSDVVRQWCVLKCAVIRYPSFSLHNNNGHYCDRVLLDAVC